MAKVDETTEKSANMSWKAGSLLSHQFEDSKKITLARDEEG